jgi:hypothetical protein
MSYSNKMEYFDDDDFELMFKTFDFFKKEEVPLTYLFYALDLIGYKYEKPVILLRYKLKEDEKLPKKVFLKIMKREYNKMISLETSNN